MRRPTIDQLPQPLAARAAAVARTVAEAGFRAWIVGGTVRDLALGLEPKDLDMASAATPDEIEGLFPRSLGVGKAFGTIVLPGDPDVELTTFRSEAGYADGRRPDRVEYGVALESDAARRDFTVNALYLDPLDGTLADPTGGLDDLAARRLRTVGDPALRFAEDALRLLRLGRFAGRYGFEVPADVIAAARACAPKLAQVSGERVGAELERIGNQPGTAQAVDVLVAIGALAICFPGRTDGHRAAALERVRALGDGPGFEALMAALLLEGERDDLDRVKPARSQRSAVARYWALAAATAQDSGRASLLRALRELDEGAALAWSGALAATEPARFAAGDRALRAAADAVPADGRRPAPLLDSTDLERVGIERGPLWGQLLAEHEDGQLNGELTDRDAALDWLRRRADQLGGNTRRS